MKTTNKESTMSTKTTRPPADLKSRIEQVLSEILSDKYGHKITLKFEPTNGKERTA